MVSLKKVHKLNLTHSNIHMQESFSPLWTFKNKKAKPSRFYLMYENEKKFNFICSENVCFQVNYLVLMLSISRNLLIHSLHSSILCLSYGQLTKEKIKIKIILLTCSHKTYKNSLLNVQVPIKTLYS